MKLRRRLAFAGLIVVVQTVAAVALTSPSSAATPALLYVFAGQSNMVGAATSTAELARIDPTLNAPQDTVRFWGPTEDTPRQWASIQPPTEVQQAYSHMGFGPEISAATLLSRRHAQSTIGIVKVSRGGTSLASAWNAQNPIGLYPILVGEVRAAQRRLEEQTSGPVRIAGFFWMQGESDAQFRGMAQYYAANLETFIGAVRRDLGAPNLPFVIGRIGEMKDDAGSYGYAATVRLAERDVARRTPATYLVSTDGLERAPNSPVHLSTRGTIDLGRRFVNVTPSL